MGMCQSRPSVANNGSGNPNASPVGEIAVNGVSTSASSSRWNKRSGLLRRRNSESSVVTIIPEATEEDVWNDHDSLTEGGMVYDATSKQRISVRHKQQQPHIVSSPASGLLTPSTTAESLTHATAPSVDSSSPPADLDSFVHDDDDDGLSSSSSTSSTDSDLNINHPGTTTIASFTPYSLVSPLAKTKTAVVAAVATAAQNDDDNLCLMEDDDSTAMVIEEEEDPCAPSDESDVENTKEDVEENEIEPGRLICKSNNTPSSQPTKATTSGRSFKLLPSRFKNKTPPTRSSVPHSSSSNASKKKAVDAPGVVIPPEPISSVDPRTLSHFHRLELQAKLAKQAQLKQHKQRKYQDRYQDVHGYKQLWNEYQTLHQQLVQKEQASGTTSDEVHESLQSPVGTSELQGQVEQAVVVPATEPTRRGRSSNNSRQPRPRRRAQSFDLHDSTNWYFDFQAVDFAYEGFEHDPHQIQTSLSLLSESSMEIQKRLYADKRRFRKLQKKLKKRHSKGKRSTPTDESATAMTPVSNLLSALEMTTSTTPVVIPRRDYGPSRRGTSGASSVHSAPVVGSYYQDPLQQQYDAADLTSPTEWVDHEIQCCDANSSCMSDMGDTASYTSNDYRVPRRSSRSYYGSITTTRSSHHDKLAELEAKVQALQERNAELAGESTTGTSSSHGTPSSPNGALASADVNASSPTSDPTTTTDTNKTPVANNRVAALCRMYESNPTEGSINPAAIRAWQTTSTESDAVEEEDRHAPIIALQYLQQQPCVVADESSEDLGPDVSILSAIEESMTSFTSSPDRSMMESNSNETSAPHPPSPLLTRSPTIPEDVASTGDSTMGSSSRNTPTPGKRLEATLNLEASPTEPNPSSINDEEPITLLLLPDESIDVPPQEDHPLPTPVEMTTRSTATSKMETSAESPAPLQSAIGCEMPSLVGLETLSSTVTASEDDEYDDPTSEEKKVDDSDDPTSEEKKEDESTFGKEASPSKSSLADLDSSAMSEDIDIFDKLAKGEFDEEESDLVLEATPVKVCKPDPPGKAILNGTPSLELKRRPWAIDSPVKTRFSALGNYQPHSDPTPTVTPARSPSNSPMKSRSPQKNRWIAELSTREFLAMSEENALERLARIERREAQRASASLYNPIEDDSELETPLEEAELTLSEDEYQSKPHSLVYEGCGEIVTSGDTVQGENPLDETALASKDFAHSENADSLAIDARVVAPLQDDLTLRGFPAVTEERSEYVTSILPEYVTSILTGDDAASTGMGTSVLPTEQASEVDTEVTVDSGGVGPLDKEFPGVASDKVLVQHTTLESSQATEVLPERVVSEDNDAAVVLDSFHANLEFASCAVGETSLGEAPEDEDLVPPKGETAVESLEPSSGKFDALGEPELSQSGIVKQGDTEDSEVPRNVVFVETKPEDSPIGLDLKDVAQNSSFKWLEEYLEVQAAADYPGEAEPEVSESAVEQMDVPFAVDRQEDANSSTTRQEPMHGDALSFSSLVVKLNSVEATTPTEVETANSSVAENATCDEQVAAQPDSDLSEGVAYEGMTPTKAIPADSSTAKIDSVVHVAIVDETVFDEPDAVAASIDQESSVLAVEQPRESETPSLPAVPSPTTAGLPVLEDQEMAEPVPDSITSDTSADAKSPVQVDSTVILPKQGPELIEPSVVEEVHVGKDEVIGTSPSISHVEVPSINSDGVNDAYADVVNTPVNRDRPSASWLGSATSSLELADTIEKEVQEVLARYRGWSVDAIGASTSDQVVDNMKMYEYEDDAPDDERRATALAKQSQQLQRMPMQE